MSNKTDKFDDRIRDRLYDLEIETAPDDWEAIEKRLPQPGTISMRKRWMYAAAGILLLLSVGSAIYMYTHKPAVIAPTTCKTDGQKDERLPEELPPAPPCQSPQPSIQSTHGQKESKAIITKEQPARNREVPHLQPLTANAIILPLPTTLSPPTLITASTGRVTEESSPALIAHSRNTRKWRFGTGISGLQLGSSSSVNTYLLRSSAVENVSLSKLNAARDMISERTPKTNINHKMPLSFGLSVNRYIHNSWSIAGGLTYTLLRSEWETTGTYSSETKQNLHFIGLPLSLTCRIMEYRRFILYASAGGMIEMNFSGMRKTSSYIDGTKAAKPEIERVRMKEPQFSLGAHVGISYPLIYPISAFIEAGTSYYFNNGSNIETIYSEKPFYISPQIGLRLSF
jgi:hypothetical protein